jgi:hypothetical protein
MRAPVVSSCPLPWYRRVFNFPVFTSAYIYFLPWSAEPVRLLHPPTKRIDVDLNPSGKDTLTSSRIILVCYAENVRLTFLC